MLDNPQLVQQATNAFNKFSHDKNGALQAIHAFGGEAMVDKAISMVKKYPIADFALRGFGINVDAVRSELFGNGNADHPTSLKSRNATPSYRDRLNKLR